MTAESPPLKVVLCWHMHQPHYYDATGGSYRQPWTYLHGIKDYVDMAAHLEAEPRARAVVNFAPVLLDQLADYATQVADALAHGTTIRDPLLQALAAPAPPAEPNERRRLVQACLRAHERRVIERFPAYHGLVELARWFDARPDNLRYLDNSRYLADLVTWYHLAWLGESVRRGDPRVRALEVRGGDFTLHDRRELLAVIGEVLAGLIPRYRALAGEGRVELSFTPYAHPILPLLLDPAAAREAQPGVALPSNPDYPGGEARARWHIDQGLAAFEHHFGLRPVGCWPAEGGVSAPALALLDAAGLKWAASGEAVLRNSLGLGSAIGADPRKPWLHRAYRLEGQALRTFFRDDGLSDLIGFSYADWHADDAVGNLIHHLENIAAYCAGRPGSVVSIILDGENAWEHYPENGRHFLASLYRRLADHPGLELTTFAACCGDDTSTEPLPKMVAGSWVYGTFSTWIGDADKNRAWEMLIDAKRAYDTALATGRLTDDQADAVSRQLALCEGSDWFWWFGDYNPADAVSDFEQLYRAQLGQLYLLLGVEPPEYLAHTFARGHGAPERGGAMRRGG
jgi:alpha-amylase/alpha-mannosidase (GH57 family)